MPSTDPAIPGKGCASTAPGRYRFVVRAASADGTTSARPASVAFTILPPLWRRWWFVTLAVAVLASLAYALHRYRLARLLEVERLRMRIATDLHDDIGSSLSQITVLSQVAMQQVERLDSRLREALDGIGDLSRDLVDAMGEIVWAIDPRDATG